MRLVILIVMALVASLCVAETGVAKNSKLFSRPRLSYSPVKGTTGSSTNSIDSSGSAVAVETEKQMTVHAKREKKEKNESVGGDSSGVLESLRDEIAYIGEGFIYSENKEEVIEHITDVFERHKGLISGAVLATIVGKMSGPARHGVSVARTSANSLRAAEIAKWGTRKP